jgi:hypothetical protein
LQRDLKAFFGAYKDAIKEATGLLFSVGNTENITTACVEAHKGLGCGILEGHHSLTIPNQLARDESV